MPKILVADDSRFQVELLRRGLQGKDFEVVVAQDALQAVMIALRTAPDATVLDINMPGGSGIEVLKRLRRSTKTRGIPVVVVSGNEDADIQQGGDGIGRCQVPRKACQCRATWQGTSRVVVCASFNHNVLLFCPAPKSRCGLATQREKHQFSADEELSRRRVPAEELTSGRALRFWQISSD